MKRPQFNDCHSDEARFHDFTNSSSRAEINGRDSVPKMIHALDLVLHKFSLRKDESVSELTTIQEGRLVRFL